MNAAARSIHLQKLRPEGLRLAGFHQPGPVNRDGVLVADRSCGATISLAGVPVGLFVDGACPQSPGAYRYMPMRSIGHFNLSAMVQCGQIPRCLCAASRQIISSDVSAIPSYGVLSIRNVAVSHDQGIPDGLDHRPQPLPPWLLTPGAQYTHPRKWHGDSFVRLVWHPFWDALSAEGRADYLVRFASPSGWERFLEDVAFDQEVARIDAEDIPSGALQPNVSPRPEPRAQHRSLWRRLFRWH